jgi:ATP-dependent Clp protease ATP-binding subunit ClpC
VIAQQISECEDRIRFVIGRIDNAIANHDFEGARFYSTEEENERAKLKLLCGGLKDPKEGEP